MIKKWIPVIFIAGLGFLGSALLMTLMAENLSLSEEQPPAELLTRGRELFNAKEGLGVKYACILCHQKEKVIPRDKVLKLGDKLPDVINQHILEKSKGKKPLLKDSDDMKALMAYIRYEHSR